MTWMLNNSKGKPDAALTAAIASTVVVLLKVLGAGLVITWGAKTITVGAIDSGLATGVLGVTWATYWGRRHTDSKAAQQPGA